ncbi:hypothetical protein F53441_11177 [Fusarium austroafricanum]|uniref:alpha-L-rhamnosidase n=1 Tax=Fusarium austroafricanum TaxID=2364996 RepID=A0A8H4NMV4_9HYPO|nr:hypothetical protein F53441_11177 [Fusarium austroafricanum]
MASIKLSKPAFEHHSTGFGIAHSKPRISWKFLTTDATFNWIQKGYDIEITSLTTPTRPEGNTTTYHVESEQSVLVPWPAPPLESREVATVRVRAYSTSYPEPTEWSPAATVEAALLSKNDWSASFITSASHHGPEAPLQPIRFRKEFTLPDHVCQQQSKCRLYITALGVFDVYINGHLASDECMAPGWTSYKHRLTYSTLDVTSLLNLESGGRNMIAAEVGEGWYAGTLGFRGGTRFNYGGNEVALLAQLEITHDPKEQPWGLVTDGSWECTPSPIISSELYNGETYDMRLECDGWNAVRSKESAEDASFAPYPTKVLSRNPTQSIIASEVPPVRVTRMITPSKVFKSDSGKLIIDFGQNLVGKIMIKSLHLPASTTLTLKHAEVMEHGELGSRPLNHAKCTDMIISSGKRLEDWYPKFTFHGFRYVQVEVLGSSLHQETLDAESLLHLGDDVTNVIALVMHSDMNRRGHFTSSNDSINKLHQNVVWSMRGNFLSIPTDCPQRDERLGWTGDIQVFCPTASFLYDTTGFLSGWLDELAAEQLLEEGRGGVPGVVCPDVRLPGWPKRMPQALWHDATVLVPYSLYTSSGDIELLEKQFESMHAWLEQGVDRDRGDGLWNPDRWQFGDWLDPTAPPDQPGYSRTDSVMVADAYLVHVTSVFATICRLLSKNTLADKYDSDEARLRSLFQDRYITPEGNLMGSTQTGIALAACFSLYRNGEKEVTAAASALSKLVRAAQFKIGTGFAGTPLITHALTRTAQPQLAYRMLLEKSCPSWMYPVTMGATTVWERWNSMLPDGSINPGRMTSFNHYALGAVADWLHGTVGGISPMPSSPGWKVFRVKPIPGGNLEWADTSFDGPYGRIECKWRWSSESGDFNMALVVPPNSSALVTLPSELGDDPAKAYDDERVKSRLVGSGLHNFHCQYVAAEWPPRPILSPNLSWQAEDEDLAC